VLSVAPLKITNHVNYTSIWTTQTPPQGKKLFQGSCHISIFLLYMFKFHTYLSWILINILISALIQNFLPMLKIIYSMDFHCQVFTFSILGIIKICCCIAQVSNKLI